MKVYRFEKPNKDGPYRPAKGYTDALGFLSGEEDIPALDYYAASGEKEGSVADRRLRPLPIMDFTAMQLSGHKPDEFQFAFASTAQALAWFPSTKGREALSRDGIQLDVYEVPKDYVVEGKHQVMFYKGHETLVDTLNAVTLD